MSVRVRYAPSPTGSPHVGNIRTALFCHLFARGQNGTNILRIEDTDRARTVPGCEEEIQESLAWIGVVPDEGPVQGGPYAPYRQSDRSELGIYDSAVQKLLADGNAYKAFDTPEELAEMREFQQVNKQPIGYFGGVWRDATPEAVAEAEAAGKKAVIRLKMPRGRKIVCQDAIRGRIEWLSDDQDDPVLIKADGMPTYHCAAMVDDHIMGITHVIRGEEWISSAPKHLWLYEALGWKPPSFVHVPVIKGKDGAKLSKRHGDTRCLDYRAAGYLPEALTNFIALIGWSPGGDREVMTMEEMANAFSLDGLQPSPGVFDAEKLLWMNGHYIRHQSADDLLRKAVAYCGAEDSKAYWREHDETKIAALELLAQAAAQDADYVRSALVLEQERVQTLAELAVSSAFFFQELPPIEQAARDKWLGVEHGPELFGALLAECRARKSMTIEEAEGWVRSYAADHGMEKIGPVVHPIRVALTGRTNGPGLFELMSVLGPERMAKRLEAVLL